jgi:outer membrane lipoprotein-sorting protein
MSRPVTAGLALLVLVAVLFMGVLPAASQDAAERLLGGVTVEQVARHAIIAPQIVDYEGTKVLSILRGQAMETVTVSEAHKRPNRMRLEFLSPEEVAGRLVVDDGIQTWHYEPRLHVVIQGPTLGAQREGPFDRLLERYMISLLSLEEVIGRQTAVLSLKPRQGRGERRLWIDRTTGVALRTEERDPDDGLVSTTYFTRISYGLNFPDALFRPRIPAGARVVSPAEPSGPLVSVPRLQQAVGFAINAPQTLPGGFTLVGGEPVHGGPLRAAYLRYTDGARQVGLFMAPSARLGPPGRGAAVPALGGEARAMGWGPTRLVQWEARGVRLTLIGPLPLADLVQIARSLSGR